LRVAAVLLLEDVGDAVRLDGKEPMAEGGVTGHWSTWLRGQGRRWRGEGANKDVIESIERKVMGHGHRWWVLADRRLQ
jgi:hypothetical protein